MSTPPDSSHPVPSAPSVSSVVKRPVRPRPRTFESFPAGSICPICGTNDDGECVLIAIDGTDHGNLTEAQPTHLACAVATRYSKTAHAIYRKARV